MHSKVIGRMVISSNYGTITGHKRSLNHGRSFALASQTLKTYSFMNASYLRHPSGLCFLFICSPPGRLYGE